MYLSKERKETVTFTLREDEISNRARAILGIDGDFTDDERKYGYWSMSKKYYPDKHPDNPNAHELFQLVNEANQWVKGEEKNPTLLKMDKLVEILTQNPVTPLDNIPTYDEWIIQKGFYDFIRPN